MLGKYVLRARVRSAVAIAAVAACALSLAAAPAAAAPKVGTFQTRASSPKPVNNVAVDPNTHMIYAQQYRGTGFYRYDPKTNKWTTLARALIPQGENGGAAYLNGKIYAVYPADATVMEVYDIATKKWSPLPNPLDEGTTDITAVGGLLYLLDDDSFVSYNPATHKTRLLSGPPFGFSAWAGLAPYKGMIYGQTGDENETDFAAYDIATDAWTTLPEMPDGAVQGAAIDQVGGTFYAYGSYGGQNFYRYDIATGTWRSTLTFPFHHLNDGGMAYVSARGLQGIYATYGQGSKGFTRYVTPSPPH